MRDMRLTVISYDGTSLVERSIAMDEPIIYVSMNYRVSGTYSPDLATFPPHHRPLPAFGFLAGKEVRDAKVANLGLHDRTSFDIHRSAKLKHQIQSDWR